MAQTTPTHASGFHLVTVAMTGHAEEMGSTTVAHSSLNCVVLNTVNESRRDNMGFCRYDQLGGCLPGTSEDNIALHRCQRSHRRYTSIERGQLPANTEKHDQCNAHCLVMVVYRCPLRQVLPPRSTVITLTKYRISASNHQASNQPFDHIDTIPCSRSCSLLLH